MSIILETERLVLRKFNITDAPFILELLNTSTWKQYIGDRGLTSIADAQTYLVKVPLMNYAVNGFGLYMVELRGSGEPIGMCGLLKREYLAHLDIGYALLPQYEGNGYAYEAAAATVEYSFNQLNQQTLAAITNIQNQRSIKLLNKLGFTYDKNIWADGHELMMFIKDAES
ncbi:GNAT family N-acetyltransferase [Mucilaginibacter terrae]|uniref:Ribosomal-protein-alanine N-acetyltransferase n=1 Tax=Mucilaginibacter terrae TaxID=1955052 RepID=A0ABU3GZV5_9SPHI|nr:GNAT family N-acetyltransferase [Mucilaginibacter terrae]MDT3404180.1 ribosomal-protein-alanine N-acetyltransferase [Mucilaginibacter terrae]